jgi:hypothetical protein
MAHTQVVWINLPISASTSFYDAANNTMSRSCAFRKWMLEKKSLIAECAVRLAALPAWTRFVQRTSVLFPHLLTPHWQEHARAGPLGWAPTSAHAHTNAYRNARVVGRLHGKRAASQPSPRPDSGHASARSRGGLAQVLPVR